MSEHSSLMPWVQKDVQHVQHAPQCHPHVSVITRSPSSQTSLNGQKNLSNNHSEQDLENLENLNIATTSHRYPAPDLALHQSKRGDHSYTNNPTTLTHNPNSKQYKNLTNNTSVTPVKNKTSLRASNPSAEPRPCLVCGEKAGKHSYYGAQVSPSCRAFFRRSVQSGYNASYFCPNDKNCKINLKTRRSCQFCRYKLCEASGMKPAWVLTEDERRQKSEGRNKGKISSIDINKQNLNDFFSTNLCSEDLAAMERYVKASSTFDPTQLRDMDTSLIRQIIR